MKLVRFVCFGFVVFALNACFQGEDHSRLHDGSDGRQKFADRLETLGIDSRTPLSESSWNDLDLESKEELVQMTSGLESGFWPGMKSIDFRKILNKPIVPNDLYYIPYRAFAQQIDEDMRDIVYMDVMDTDGSHSTIGAPHIKWLRYLVRVSDHKVFGAEIGYFQLGCDMPDFSDDVKSFATTEEAEASGCDLSDVSWQADGTYGLGGERIRYSESYMEWSGY